MSERELAHLGRLYSALSHINQAIVRLPSRAQLFQQTCDALVEHGGFVMAWLSWLEPDTQRLAPVAAAGEHRDLALNGYVYADGRGDGRGPTGVAFRTRAPVVCNDFEADDALAPWRDVLHPRGLRSVAVFPLRHAGMVQGTLCVYAAERGFFQQRELALLVEVAADISFALDNLEREAEQARLAAIIESSEDAIISTNLAGTIVSWNRAAEYMFGYQSEEIIGSSIDLIVPDERRGEDPVLRQRILAGEHVGQFDTTRVRRDGTTFPVSVTSSRVMGRDANGDAAVIGVSKILRDQTRAERERHFIEGLMNAAPGVLYLYDEQGRFLRWNDEFQRVCGYSADEIRKLHPLDLFEGEERARVEARIADVFVKGEARIEAYLTSKNGTRTPFLFTGRAVELDGRRCLVGMGTEISDRLSVELALRASEARYRSTLDDMMEGCQLLGFDWRYLYLNESAAKHNRRSNAELLLRTMPEAWPGIEASPVFELLRRCMEERVPAQGEIEFSFADGTSSWFDVRAQPVPEGVFVLSIDITERHRAETALLDLNRELEVKVEARTRDLAVARDRAESADRTKSAFLATMSHELRTPLNAILGFSGIMLEGLAGPLNAEQQKQLGMVQQAGQHLLELINDVLDISKIEAGELELQFTRFSIPASILSIVELVRPLAEKKKLSLLVDVESSLTGMRSDQRRVEQILINFMTNAIKFTPRGEVALTMRAVEIASGAAVQVAVRDTGIGIRHEDLDKLFKPFRQLDDGMRRLNEGTGLGLAICRRLTDLLGGTIEVDSELGKGSTFTVTLPLDTTG